MHGHLCLYNANRPSVKAHGNARKHARTCFISAPPLEQAILYIFTLKQVYESDIQYVYGLDSRYVYAAYLHDQVLGTG